MGFNGVIQNLGLGLFPVILGGIFESSAGSNEKTRTNQD
jgi:hypothetical protein